MLASSLSCTVIRAIGARSHLPLYTCYERYLLVLLGLGLAPHLERHSQASTSSTRVALDVPHLVYTRPTCFPPSPSLQLSPDPRDPSQSSTRAMKCCLCSAIRRQGLSLEYMYVDLLPTPSSTSCSMNLLPQAQANSYVVAHTLLGLSWGQPRPRTGRRLARNDCNQRDLRGVWPSARIS